MRIRISVKVPKDFMKDINFQSIIARKQRNTTAPDLLKYFNDTVDGWEHKTDFGYKQIINSARISIQVGPKGVFGGSNKAYNIYRLVNNGSPSHEITPRKGGLLKYRKGYISSTRPGDLISNRKSYSGDFFFSRKVYHPGFEGRHFDKMIAEDYGDKFMRDMQDAINEAVRKS